MNAGAASRFDINGKPSSIRKLKIKGFFQVLGSGFQVNAQLSMLAAHGQVGGVGVTVRSRVALP